MNRSIKFSLVAWSIITFSLGIAVLAQDPQPMDLPVHPDNEVKQPTGIETKPLPIIEEQPREKDPRDEPPPVIYGEEIDAEGGSLVFVLDISGSMDEYTQPWATGLGVDGKSVPMQDGPEPPTRIQAAKRELIRSISSLSPNIRFNVYAFDCQTIKWSWELLAAEPANKASASAWVNALHAGGATGTGPATALALSAHRECTSYVLLTDGEPNCGFDSYIHRRIINDANAQRAVITVFGIAAWGGHRLFCQWVASDSGGAYFDVY